MCTLGESNLYDWINNIPALGSKDLKVAEFETSELSYMRRSIVVLGIVSDIERIGEGVGHKEREGKVRDMIQDNAAKVELSAGGQGAVGTKNLPPDTGLYKNCYLTYH